MTIRKHVKVRQGGVIQIEDPLLPEGDAEVTIETSEAEPVYAEARLLFEEVARITASVPDEEWAKLPSDLSVNRRHYRYGWPKEEE
jgi:hypothetical protein